jgi:hypothetical protein
VARAGAAAASVLVAALASPLAAKDLVRDLRGTWNVEKGSMFPGGVLPVDPKAPREAQDDQLEEALEDVPDVAFEFTADTMTLVLGDERHPSAFALTRTDRRSVYFDAVDRTQAKATPDRMRAEFVDADTVKLTKAGDPQVLLLKRARATRR